MKTLEVVLHDWLLLLRIDVPFSQLEEKLLSHPEYPSLVAITDTLDDMDIPNTSVEMGLESLSAIEDPYLVFLYSNGGEYALIKKDPVKEVPHFEERWANIVLVAERPEGQKRKAPETIGYSLLAGIVMALLGGTAILLEKQWLFGILVLIHGVGILISGMIISSEMGIFNRMAGKLCNDSCDSIIGTKKSLPFAGISLADLCITWFTAQFLFLFIAAVSTGFAGIVLLLTQLSVVAVIPTFFTLYYQAFTARKWCRMCLAVTALLWAQAALLVAYNGTSIFTFPQALPLLLFSGISLVVMMVWTRVKKIITDASEKQKELFNLRRSLHSWKMFHAALQQEPVGITGDFISEISLGNENAPMQLVMASSITCQPCAEAFNAAEVILDKFPGRINIRIRFKIPNVAGNEQRMAMLKHISGVLVGKQDAQTRRKVLGEWFRNMDITRFSRQYPLTPADAEKAGVFLSECKSWFAMNKIQTTPSLFINEKMLPKEYSIDDFFKIIRYYPEECFSMSNIMA